MRFAVCIVVLVCAALLPLGAAPPPDAAFVTMQGSGIMMEIVHDVIAKMAEVGGHAYHVMPTHAATPERELSGCCLIGSLPPGQEPLIAAMPFVTEVYRGWVDPGMVLPMGEEAVYAANAWNYLLDEVIEPTPPGLDPFPDDALGPLENGELPPTGVGGARQPLTAPGQYQTSEFMVGSVSIGVVLPESTGSGENWSNFDPLYPGQNRRTLVYNKIVGGANWWATQGGTSAAITIFYDQRMGISTTYEPINISSASNGELTWVNSTLATMGFSGTSWQPSYDYANWMRSTYGTDWGYAVFVADSLNDTDGMFPNFTSAFAYLYGPYQVMTYDNGTTGGQWTLSRMNQVFAHESGHIFGAPDEYAGAGTCTCTNYGYLGVTNGNCVNCIANQATCVMNDNSLQLCTYTKGHVGWRDSDSDGILDPVDVTVSITSGYLDYANNPYSSNSQITGHGTAQAGAWPSTTRTPVSINRVRVLYGVDASASILTTPRDGAFNSDFENFDFTTAPQSNGPHNVFLAAADNYGNSSSLSPMYIIIDTTPPPLAPPSATILEAPFSANPNAATATWTPCPNDPESGIIGHQVSLWQVSPPPPSFMPLASQFVPLPALGHGFLVPQMPPLLHAGVYHVTVHGVNGALLNSPPVGSPVLTIDLTPPGQVASIQDSGAGTDQFDRLAFNWTASVEDVSPITDYFLDIQDNTGISIWGNWIGSAGTSHTAMPLSLLPGNTYAGRVRAKNAAGLVGILSGPSDGIMAVTFYLSIGQVKTNATTGIPVGVRGVYATSSGSDAPGVVYAQQLDRSCGIRLDATDSITKGSKVEIAGLVQPNANGELELYNSEVALEGGSATLRPIAVSGRSLGGGTLGLQPGVTGGSGLNNIGLYVQTWGRVTYSSAGYFTIDDGSGMVGQMGNNGIGVRCGSIAPPATGFVNVRGICSYESGLPVVLLRQAGDWW